MAKDMLDFLHPEAPLIQKGSACVTGLMVIQPEISGRQMKAVRDIKR